MLDLRATAWSPYAAGVAIGLLQLPAFLLIDTALGTSSSYVTVSASLVTWIDPSIRAIGYAAKHLDGAKNWWQVALVVGIVLGAALSARLSGMRRSGISPIWATALGTESRPIRFLMAFGGGFVMLLGARVADGCTSGHGLSGMAQLAIGSFIVVAAMFAGGIAAAFVLKRI